MNQLPATERMLSLLGQWQQIDDRRYVFLNCYYLMTSNMLRAIQAGEFRDSYWVGHLLEHFAGYYFNALDAYDAGQAAATEERLPGEAGQAAATEGRLFGKAGQANGHVGGAPAVWRFTFDAACNPKMHVMQHLLLGINAHINCDLVFAVADLLEPEWAALNPQQRQMRYTDHCHVNHVIAVTIDSVQDTVVERFSPAMNLVDKGLGPLDEWAAVKLITFYRDRVWKQAIRLVELPPSEARQALRQEVEQTSLSRAHLIAAEDVGASLKRLFVHG